MRWFVIPSLLAMATLAAVSVSAEAIHLKNGDVIWADQVRTIGTSVEYEIGDNSYRIPQSRVARIDAAARPASSPPAVSELPSFSPGAYSADEQELFGKVVRDGQVDRGVLAEMEARGNRAQTAVAFYIAARSEFEGGKYDKARRDFEVALSYDPQNPAVLNYYAALLVRTGDAREAVFYAERAVRIAPHSADALAVLGYAQFAADRPREAVESWKKSLALRADSSIQQMLARAQRESAAESNYSEHDSAHFVLRYEGNGSSEAFRQELLARLEDDYQELAREFGSQPRSAISVILYPQHAFFDVTRAPSWTGALNDGKLRIPIEGLSSVTSDLARVLKHELAHSFINHLSRGRCPQWLNEGMAQLLEPQSLGPRAPRLAELFKRDRELPLNSLDAGFFSFSGIEAALAYDESLAFVEYLQSRYGISDLLRILERIGQGESPEAALRATIHSDYRQLDDELRAYLLRALPN
jgi:Tfp pilus assembly protein PilF